MVTQEAMVIYICSICWLLADKLRDLSQAALFYDLTTDSVANNFVTVDAYRFYTKWFFL